MTDLMSTPDGPQRLPALDVLRVVGALAVVGHHVGFATGATMNATWGGWLARLDVGVALFFVLSGFLLFRPYAHAIATGTRRIGVRSYLWRRALRILPAYWLTVVVCLTVLPQNRSASALDWLRHLTLTQIYQPAKLRLGLSQTWSLATEVAFYVLLPLLAFLALGRRWRPRRAAAIVATGLLVTAGWLTAMALGQLDMGLHTMWLPAYGGWFAGGMVLAVAHVAIRTNSAPPRWRILDELGAAPLTCWAIAVGLLATATTPVAGPRDLAEPTAGEFAVKLVLYLVIALMVLLPLAFGPPTPAKSVSSTGVARWLGTMSYGLFLWHPLVLESIYALGGRQPFTGDLTTTFLATAAGGLTLGTISYYAVERPFQRLARSRSSRRPGTKVENQSAVAVPSAAN
ncbi:acyltransferase family protein [Micromonospora sonneratiae]|uniref:Acyltransferase family protein n=1 Tax=Micromonospora sonneratiae TaxID=1184706 RepID=A0ABW3YHB2_9ACTN